MNDSIYRISLDMHECIVQKSLKVKKNDNARVLKISLVDNGKIFEIAEGCVATFRAKKPDGTVLFNNCTIENNVITYELTNQTSAVVGEVECEVTLYDSDNKQITSPRFSLVVTDTLYSDDEIESQDEFNQIAYTLTEANVIKGEVEQFKNLASNYADASATSATNAKESEDNALASELNAKTFSDMANLSKEFAETSEVNAKASELNAKASEEKALDSENNALTSETNAKTSETNARTYSADAEESYNKAKMSEVNSKASEINAKTSEDNAKASEDNAKTSEENVNEAYEEILALIGSITDVPVTGVKGDAEEEYREGQVNITPENIGLGNVPNVTTDNQTPTFTMASSDAELVSGETLSTTLGKIARIVSSLISHKADSNIHVTNSDKEDWNGHIADEDIHVTQTDKIKWNEYDTNKVTQKVYYAFGKDVNVESDRLDAIEEFTKDMSNNSCLVGVIHYGFNAVECICAKDSSGIIMVCELGGEAVGYIQLWIKVDYNDWRKSQGVMDKIREVNAKTVTNASAIEKRVVVHNYDANADFNVLQNRFDAYESIYQQYPDDISIVGTVRFVNASGSGSYFEYIMSKYKYGSGVYVGVIEIIRTTASPIGHINILGRTASGVWLNNWSSKELEDLVGNVPNKPTKYTISIGGTLTIPFPENSKQWTLSCHNPTTSGNCFVAGNISGSGVVVYSSFSSGYTVTKEKNQLTIGNNTNYASAVYLTYLN